MTETFSISLPVEGSERTCRCAQRIYNRLAGIAGNQRALREAKRSLKEAKGIKTLTLLGMVFIPLAFCTGLFSMNDQYLPGTASFWIYFAVSIPLIVAVFLFAFLINLGYDTEGEWNLATLLLTLCKGRV